MQQRDNISDQQQLIIAYFTILETASSWTINRLLGGGSINERIVRGLMVYGKLPLHHKIIGVGLNNLGTYMQANGISTIYDESNLNYASSVVQTLNYSGLIGFISLLSFYIHLINKCRKRHISDVQDKRASYEKGVSLTLVILLIYISFFEAILFTYRFTYLLVLVEGTRKIESGRA